ncbi:MAG: TonB-dependent receptor [Cephaloticoccus sp.]|nr:TonB-dependent receptor [Cephaloticoccus sp.]
MIILLCVPAFGWSSPAPTTSRFDLPADTAEVSLKRFSEQSGLEVLFASRIAVGVRTKPVYGERTPASALTEMLANTGLSAERSEVDGVIIIKQSNTPSPMKTSVLDKIRRALIGVLVVVGPATASAQAVDENSSDTPEKETVVQLSAFKVTSEKDYGYRKMTSVTSSRTGEDVSKMPQAIEVISGELLSDFLANTGNAAFRYSSSVTVKENAVGQADIFNLRGFALPRYYNGVALANSYSSVPVNIWDNIDRIEVVKGPVGLYYANSTPNGVANYITKKPQFINATSLELTAGSYDFYKVIADHQAKLNNKAALRVIASANERGSGYHDGNPTRYKFAAASLIVRPYSKLEIIAEASYLNEHNGYQGGANAWGYFINPQWQQDLNNPSAQILSYFRNTYNLADDTAARAFILNRWSPPNNPAGPSLNTWSADLLAITGKAPFPYVNQDVNWSLYSPVGDRIAPQSSQSTYGGVTPTYEVSILLTPLENLSLRYHWAHQETHQQFVRQIIQPNTNGFRADGRVNSLDVANLALQGFGDNSRLNKSDAQQFDVSYQLELGGTKHQIGAGYERFRQYSQLTTAALDFNRAGTYTYGNGNTYSGIAIYRNYDPFSGDPVPSLYALQSGPTTFAFGGLNKNEQYYLSYRGSFWEDRVNALFGVNRYEVVFPKPAGGNADTNTTYTYGVIAEVVKGFSLFASKSEAVQFTSQVSVLGPGVLPSDNVQPLANETDTGYEFGLKTTWNDNELTGTLSYYHSEREGVVGGDVIRTTTDPRNTMGTQVQFFVNGGLYRSRGIDTDITWTPNNRFQAVFNYNRSLEASIVSDPSVNPNTPGSLDYQKKFGRPLSQSPKHRMNIVTKYNFDEGMLKNVSVGAAVRYNSTYSITNATPYDLWAPAATMADFFVSYRMKIVNTPTELKLNVNNLTDYRDDYTWGDGRVIYGSVKFSF